ncbi:putative transcription factor WRKY family [Lupinus albus]|uniref:Putative transcription factor WRKY family n=1 Tax=Lupinus albus TaxID=3870 RepID=A0A6A4NZ01_LUPAL|nr:putative transcription factor WRKY family [Lupinus albus]
MNFSLLISCNSLPLLLNILYLINLYHILILNNGLRKKKGNFALGNQRQMIYQSYKKLKNQAKKVVCIPAPAAANSRQTGEVVPSDLWAWRKYGQKPIKGSPYPRGYYRCSSLKGCSARKQVERSRTDPNMLVITYTSEHNHPWPTQRNALAGSSRSQPPKNTNNIASTSKNSETSHKGITITKPKEEQQESKNSEGNVSLKEEIEMKDIEKQLEMDDGELSDGISYKPCMLQNITSHNNSNQSHEDFFAELGEIEADDPLNLLFTQGFNDQKESKALDPFHLFDWLGRGTNNNINDSFEEPNSKRRL